MRKRSGVWAAILWVVCAFGMSNGALAQSSSSSSSQRPATLPPLTSGYVECAGQGGTCSFTGTRYVITDSCFEYTCWFSKTVATSSHVCRGYLSMGVARCAYSVTTLGALTGLTASASTQSGVNRGAGKALDGSLDTRWEASNSTAGSWLMIQSPKPFNLEKLEVIEYGNRIRGYRLEYLSGSVWTPLQVGYGLADSPVLFNNAAYPLLTSAIRIVMTSSSAGQPSISEVRVTGTVPQP
ncbi:discoidin domain-containing protein [Viridibacterium curvum]|uniref:F5/8 type C domain-containing protein n=1 Tax=Viridibacterium curvum TaxID=1101404 RepID=A0ABP9Q6B0_9RHOO